MTTAVPTTTTVAPTTPAQVITGVPEAGQVIALTFDAGSDVGATVAILDLLAGEGIRASFGMTGAWARANPALVARIVDAGHVLINHTDSHPDMTTITTPARLAELSAAEAAVAAAGGASMKPYFRPPFGAYDASLLADLGAAGYRFSIMWTVDSLGWKGLDPAKVAARCLDGASDGGIILMHVGSQSTDADALPAVIDGLQQSGYGFVTVADLLS
jgi:peptidoglycan/xylan/chitin deacetylase (PgdA/CDA1 family)